MDTIPKGTSVRITTTNGGAVEGTLRWDHHHGFGVRVDTEAGYLEIAAWRLDTVTTTQEAAS